MCYTYKVQKVFIDGDNMGSVRDDTKQVLYYALKNVNSFAVAGKDVGNLPEAIRSTVRSCSTESCKTPAWRTEANTVVSTASPKAQP